MYTLLWLVQVVAVAGVTHGCGTPVLVPLVGVVRAAVAALGAGPGRIFSNSIKLMVEGQKFTLYQQEMLLQRAKITLNQQDMLLGRQKSTLYQHAAREAKTHTLPAGYAGREGKNYTLQGVQ